MSVGTSDVRAMQVRDGKPLTVRTVRHDDLDDVARIHIATFPDAAITALGHEAARRYYAWQMDPAHDLVGLVAQLDGRAAGYCFGGTFRGALEGFIRSNLWFIVGRIIARPFSLFDRRIARRLTLGTRTLVRSAGRRTAASRGEGSPAARGRSSPSFGILAIATHPDCQGLGVGRALMQRAETEARRRGFPRMHLSVHPANASAVRFYEGIGWRRFPSDEGAWVGAMTRDLAGTNNEPDRWDFN